MSVLPEYSTPVQAEWIDYNGHLSEAYYVLIFGFATDQVMDSLGMDAAYRGASGCSLYTVEAHIRYLQEVGDGSRVEVSTVIVGSGPKKLRLAHEMRDDAGALVATEEILCLHVGGDPVGARPFPEAVAGRIHEHPGGELPEWVGRAIR